LDKTGLEPGHSIVNVKDAGLMPTSLMMQICLPFRLAASTIVRNLNPGPPESFSCVAHFPAEKSATVPAQSARFSPAVSVSNDILKTVLVVTLMALPVSRYFALGPGPTVPVMVNARAFSATAHIRAAAQAAVANNFRLNMELTPYRCFSIAFGVLYI